MTKYPNFIRTSDKKMVNYARSTVEKLLRRAQGVGGVGEKFRGIYFGKLRSRVDYFEERAQAAMKVPKFS